ncbi:MAG TPA: NAD(+) synthase, partial [Opitutus sp.]|nr:NAD(+) synthase [Opitutus sp.]
GRGESTTDLAWDGQIVAYEMGEKIADGERFAREPKLVIADIDVERVAQERRRLSNFRDAAAQEKHRTASFQRINFELGLAHEKAPLQRALDRFPFVPDDPAKRDHDCYEAYNIQVSGLAKRIETTRSKRVMIGVSGGLDSTHALLVIARAFDLLDLPRKSIVGVTMPGFATSDTTKSNAWALMTALGIDAREVSIAPLAQRMLEDLNHPAARGEPVYDVAYENVQAGLRTDYLFRLANTEGGFVVGTGDLSELALGWCTYGVGDHMSHYSVNASVPKTLIAHLVRWVAETGQIGGAGSDVLVSVLDTDISPELVPGKSGDAPEQKTESVIGPYELQDFNLYYTLRFGFSPSKVAFLAFHAWRDRTAGRWPDEAHAVKNEYGLAIIKRNLAIFLRRFFQT